MPESSIQNEALNHLNSLSGGFASVVKLPLMLLPTDQRTGVLCIYAFGKVVDDVADGDLPIQAKLTHLEAWTSLVAGKAVTGFSEEELTTWALTYETIQKFNLNTSDFQAFIRAMRHDAGADPYAFETHADIEAYVDGTGAALARMILPILGASDPEALAYGEHLASAVKATNLLRDFTEDGEAGVIYAARQEISEAPTLSRQWLRGEATYAERQYLRELAQQHMARAKELWPAAQRTKLMPAYMLQKVYVGLLITL